MRRLFNNAYKDKRVLVTGHTGFKGSWLSLWLLELGARVTGYSLEAPSNPSHFELLGLEMRSLHGDILDKKKLARTVRSHRPDIIFHLAAQSLVRKSYKFPVETFDTNVMGTVNVLDSGRQYRVPAIIIVTSDKCYRDNTVLRGHKENDPMGGDDPYSASKGCSELAVSAYEKSFFPAEEYGQPGHHTLVASVRAGNVIGGGDWAEDRLIPDIVKMTAKGEEVIIRNPNATRPWQHVLEPLSGYLHLGSKLLSGQRDFAGSWNFAPTGESPLKVQEVVEQVRRHWDTMRYEIQHGGENPPEISSLRLDASKARTRLNWHNVWDNANTIAKTISWYKNYYEHKYLTTKEDLNEYIEDAVKKNMGWTNAGR